MIRGSWIPPVPLALGASLSGLSWLLVLAYAFSPSYGLALAWVHLVALGSFTTIALAVLVHVIPGFTDLRWRLEPLARWCAVLLPFAASGFALSLARMDLVAIAIFGTAAGSLAVIYASVACATLVQRAADRDDAAIARALLVVISFLGAAALLGAGIAAGLNAGWSGLLRIVPVHGSIAIVGWLTLLTMGVSARTFRPILQSNRRWMPLHVLSNTGMLLCAILVPVGFAIEHNAVVSAGFAIGLISALGYAADGFDRIARAANAHRPAHAFVAASLVWLIVSAGAAVAGEYPLAIVVALSGWIGQMVYAHLHHLGVRVIATTIAGDGDETRPWLLLDPRVEWMAVLLAQFAVCSLAAGVLLSSRDAFLAAAACGLGSTAAVAVNMAGAGRRIRRLLPS